MTPAFQTVAVEEATVVTVVVFGVEEVVSEGATVAAMEVEIVVVMVVDTRWEEGKTKFKDLILFSEWVYRALFSKRILNGVMLDFL